MKRPIIFAGEMVRALLDDRKTQTRHIVKPQPPKDCRSVYLPFRHEPNNWQGVCANDLIGWYGKGPYGQPGDRLWVREAWRAPSTFDALPPRDIQHSQVWYEADSGYKGAGKYRHARFMPRWASRIDLEITGVRVERLQDISAEDAKAEGWIKRPEVSNDPAVHRDAARDWYADLWEQINGKGSWAANCRVWVVEFKRVRP